MSRNQNTTMAATGSHDHHIVLRSVRRIFIFEMMLASLTWAGCQFDRHMTTLAMIHIGKKSGKALLPYTTKVCRGKTVRQFQTVTQHAVKT